MSMSPLAANAVRSAPGNGAWWPTAASSAWGRRAKAAYETAFEGAHDQRPADRSEYFASDAAVEISPSTAVSRRGMAWHGMAAEAVGILEQGRIESRFRAPVHMLALFESGVRSDGCTSVEGLPPSSLRSYGRKLIFVPAGHEYTDWQETREPPRSAYFYFDPASLPVDPDARVSNACSRPRLFFEDARLWDTAIKLKTLIEGPQASDRLYCEALGVVLAHELMRLALGTRHVEPRVRGGLATWQQRVVGEHIEEHLAEQISLTALAQLVRLSPFHFARAFKQSFGMPPHRFHTHRRIERAKALLSKPAMSVTEVGLVVGFGGTSSFTTSFRKVTGATPTDYRRSVTSFGEPIRRRTGEGADHNSGALSAPTQRRLRCSGSLP
jgi:AraC family transcriptional regulator